MVLGILGTSLKPSSDATLRLSSDTQGLVCVQLGAKLRVYENAYIAYSDSYSYSVEDTLVQNQVGIGSFINLNQAQTISTFGEVGFSSTYLKGNIDQTINEFTTKNK